MYKSFMIKKVTTLEIRVYVCKLINLGRKFNLLLGMLLVGFTAEIKS